MSPALCQHFGHLRSLRQKYVCKSASKEKFFRHRFFTAKRFSVCVKLSLGKLFIAAFICLCELPSTPNSAVKRAKDWRFEAKKAL